MRKAQQLLALLASLLASGCNRAPVTSGLDHSPHRVRFVAVAPGISLEVLDWGGQGLPLVFLSGLQDVAHGFDDFAPAFAGAHHVLALTRRGYGASSQASSGYDLDTRVADLLAVLDSLGLPRVVLAGHSIAGDELTAFAGRYPERVAGLIYLDAAYDHSNLAPLLQDYPPPPPLQPADSASPMGVQAFLLRSFGEHIPIGQVLAIGRYDSSGHLLGDVTPSWVDSLMLAGCGSPDYSRVRAPALAIYAVVDSAPQIFPLWPTFDSATQAQARQFATTAEAWATRERERFSTGVPTGTRLELHGANHYVFDSNRAEVLEAMRTFLTRLQAGT